MKELLTPVGLPAHAIMKSKVKVITKSSYEPEYIVGRSLNTDADARLDFEMPCKR
jgi:hypothetical protein